jgi:hypothetical protein
MEKTVLNPIYATINDAVESLEKMKISEDGIFDKDEADLVKKSVGIIQSELNRLIDLGLYEDSQSKLMRDRASNALRTIVLDLHNNLNEYTRSKKLLEVAVQICGTDSLKNKLNSELEQIDKNIADDTDNSLGVERRSSTKMLQVLLIIQQNTPHPYTVFQFQPDTRTTHRLLVEQIGSPSRSPLVATIVKKKKSGES